MSCSLFLSSGSAARRLSAAVGCALTLVLMGLAVSAETVSEGRPDPHPEAPPETAQFAFLIGTWNCKTRWMGPGGELAEGPDATWMGYYILDGWAIQDDWTSPLPNGSIGRGTNVRSFNPQTGKWDNRWLSQPSLQWKYYEAEKVGDTMVMTGGRGRDAAGRAFVDRNTFYDLEADSWKWRKDRSFDDGATWIEGVGHIHATRAP